MSCVVNRRSIYIFLPNEFVPISRQSIGNGAGRNYLAIGAASAPFPFVSIGCRKRRGLDGKTNYTVALVVVVLTISDSGLDVLQRGIAGGQDTIVLAD